MEITEVRIKLMDDPQDRLQAFCSITLDSCFVIRDLKIIQGTKGPFVAMPSRKLTDRCPRCRTKNHLRAQFCNQCGAKLDEERASKDDDGRAKLYADIAHPIKSECRDKIQQIVLDSFTDEQIRAQQPDYVCSYDDYGEDGFAKLSPSNETEEDVSVGQPAARTDFPGHRFESGAEDHPQPPHLAKDSNGEQRRSRIADVQRSTSGDNEEDSFGAGIL